MPISRILGPLIEEQAIDAGAEPDFVRYLRLAVFNEQSLDSNHIHSQFGALPGLCCEAVGGQREWANQLAAAWLCFYQAAHLMDSIQDQDEPEPWWADEGPALAINVASSLYFTASLLLQKLHQLPATKFAAKEIILEFYRSFFIMNNGQFSELTYSDIGLEQYWKNARAKSGTFFSLACWSGARLASEDPTKLKNFRELGNALGILIQVKDDLEEVQPPRDSMVAGQRINLAGSLPVIYSLEVLPPEDKLQLARALEKAPSQPAAANEAISLIDKSDASTYVLLEIERHRQIALNALVTIAPEKSVRDRLSLLIRSI